MTDAHGWQPISTAPRDGTRLMLWTRWTDEPIFAHWITTRHQEGWVTGWTTVGGYDAGYDWVDSPTHWQPLPAPPQDREGDDVR